MKKFFNRIFNKRIPYTVKADIKGREAVLSSIYQDKCINPETIRTGRDGDDLYFVITTSYRSIKTLIDNLCNKLDSAELFNITIYEDEDYIDLISKRRRGAWL